MNEESQEALRQKLKRLNLEVGDNGEKVLMLLLKHKYGLYAAEVAKMSDMLDAAARTTLWNLKKIGLLESKIVYSLPVFPITQGYRINLLENCKVISPQDNVIASGWGQKVKISNKDIVVDEEGFHVPFEQRAGRKARTIFKIKKEFFKILSG